MSNDNQTGKEIAAREHQERTRAGRGELSVQQNRGDEVGHEYDREHGGNEAVDSRQRGGRIGEMAAYATSVAMTTANANWRCRAVDGAVATENSNPSSAARFA